MGSERVSHHGVHGERRCGREMRLNEGRPCVNCKDASDTASNQPTAGTLQDHFTEIEMNAYVKPIELERDVRVRNTCG